jgi:uncharacterized protein
LTAHLLLLAAAGLLAGAMNAIAGGGSFATFPALVFTGLPPVIANTTSTVSLLPGTLASAWAFRDGLRGIGGVPLRWLAPITLAGGLAGGILLLFTPGGTFDAVIPWLLLLATLIFAGGRELIQAIAGKAHIGKVPMLVAQFLVALYGGYFGGAVGLMMMAVWSLFDPSELASMAPARTLMVSLANAMAVICFLFAGAVRWPELAVMLPAAVVGGYGGAVGARFLPPRLIRVAIVVLCAAVTVYFFRKSMA